MISVTVKLPSDLDKKLRATARRRGEGISTLIRRALEREIVGEGPDFATMAAPYQGMFRGPGDLSTRKAYRKA
jgi:predicted transcriptional regulator